MRTYFRVQVGMACGYEREFERLEEARTFFEEVRGTTCYTELARVTDNGSHYAESIEVDWH